MYAYTCIHTFEDLTQVVHFILQADGEDTPWVCNLGGFRARHDNEMFRERNM